MSQQPQILKPTTMNLDKAKKDLKETEAFYLLNFQNWITLNTKKTGNLLKGNQYPANRAACAMQVPAGENYAVGTYYSILTNETYGFIYNTNGVHFSSRIDSEGECQIVYYGGCLPLSADPKRMLTDFRCWMKYDKTCRNRAGKELYFVTGDFEGTIDVEASIATNNFTTPFFQRCSTGCEFLQTCVPDPPSCLTGEFILLSGNEFNLPNLVMNTGFQFKYRFVYYDFRASIWSKTSTLFYQDGLAPFKVYSNQPVMQSDFGRKIKLRVPIGNPLVEFIEIAVSENNGNTWKKIAVIPKYKKYNSAQEKWYERDLAPLPGYSDSDCSFDYYFYNDNIGETVDPAEINRNFNPHPRGAQGLLSLSLKSANSPSALGYYNYVKGNCPLDAIQVEKFRVSPIPLTYPNFYDMGLKAGGRYQFGFVLHGDCGRFSFVNSTQILQVPSTQEKNQLSFKGFQYDATGIVFPDWVTSVSIVRTPNTNGFELQWKVDSIQRVNGNIILTIQSLNDYNTDHFEKTNTVYQWLDGDRVEFIKNGGGTGTYFQPSIYGLLNYAIVNPFSDTTLSSLSPVGVNFFNQLVIKDDGRLNTLISGGIIELQRPKKVTDNLPYYEICANLSVENGRLLNETGIFNTFDTYLVWRLIQGVYIQMEHTSPNDLWPVPVNDQGRVWVENRFEDEKRYGRNMTINSPTEFNRFGDLEKVFPAPEQGDITSIGLYDGKVGVAIGENDNFLFQISDDFLRIGSDGIVRAAPADSIISDPEPKITGKFGCQYDHIGSVVFGDGFITWDDVNRHAFVKHDFSSAVDAGLGKMQLYFRTRLQELERYNRTVTNDLDKLRICTGYNKNDGTVLHTIKKLRDSGIYNEIKPFQKTNDTVVFYPDANEWLGQVSFTPEAYSQYNLFDGNGCAFITYLNGVPYYHPINSTRFNEFFGIACDQVIGVSVNKFPEKVKRFLAAEIQSEVMWFSPEVTTDKDGFISEVPPATVKKDGRKWNFPFLSNRNSKGGIYSNNPSQISDICQGYYCAVTLVRDNTDGLKYNTIDNAKRVIYSELDFLIFKFAFVEESGFTGNL